MCAPGGLTPGRRPGVQMRLWLGGGPRGAVIPCPGRELGLPRAPARLYVHLSVPRDRRPVQEVITVCPGPPALAFTFTRRCRGTADPCRRSLRFAPGRRRSRLYVHPPVPQDRQPV